IADRVKFVGSCEQYLGSDRFQCTVDSNMDLPGRENRKSECRPMNLRGGPTRASWLDAECRWDNVVGLCQNGRAHVLFYYSPSFSGDSAVGDCKGGGASWTFVDSQTWPH